jgi:hypothetical protein
MSRIKLLMVIGGVVMVYFGIQESRLANQASATPRMMTCAELAANGPGDNAHIGMSKFLLCEQAFVFEGSKRSEAYKTVWVPAVPADGEYVRTIRSMMQTIGKLDTLPPPTDIRVLVKSKHVKNEAELTALAMRDRLDGLVTNQIESIGSKEKKILEESYPGIDFSRCYIVDHDRKPSSTAMLAGMIGGGIVLAIAGGCWTLTGMRKA